MSDANLITGGDLQWPYKGQVYRLAETDLDLECIFQSRHEAYARSRLVANRTFVGENEWSRDHLAYVQAVMANQFCFDGWMFHSYIATPHGKIAYLHLKMEKGTTEISSDELKSVLQGLHRKDRKEFDRLWDLVMSNDFPNLRRPETETKPTGTNGSGLGSTPSSSHQQESQKPSTAA